MKTIIKQKKIKLNKNKNKNNGFYLHCLSCQDAKWQGTTIVAEPR